MRQLGTGLRRVRAGLLAVAAAAAASACPGDDSCMRSCNRLEACGLLPSPLGTDVGNCSARCINSVDSTRKQFEDCADLAGDGAVWMREGTASGCGGVAACLSKAPGSPVLLGRGSSAVVATLEGPVTEGDPNTVSALTFGADCAARLTPDVVVARCSALGTESVEAFVETDAFRISARGACSVMLSAAVPFSTTAGALSGGYVIRGFDPVLPADAGNDAGNDAGSVEMEQRPYCYVVRSNAVVVPAAECTGVVVWVPATREGMDAAGSPCENDAESCTDQRDNDRDGRIDCLDAECASFCLPSTIVDGARGLSGDAGSAETD